MNKQLSLLICLGSTALIGTESQAFTTHGSWSTDRAIMRAHRVSFAPNTHFRTALGVVADRWNDNPSAFRFDQRFDDRRASFDNRENEVWFSGSADYDPAVTFWWTDGGDIVEADIVFFTGQPYTTAMHKDQQWAYGGPNRPFRTTAMHEYGHALGLLHEADEYNIMGQDWTHLSLQGSECRAYPGEDASDGAVALYGRSAEVIEDVGVVHWRRTGRSGEYSEHSRTRMFDAAGAALSFDMHDGQQRYDVRPGQRVRVEFSYENNGETTQKANCRFFISTNDFISNYDRVIQTFWVRHPRNDVYTLTRTVTIPADLDVGRTYYLGVGVDYDNLIHEVTAANNHAYHIIDVN